MTDTTPKQWLKDLKQFDSECEEAQHTDVGTAWELLYQAKEIITLMTQ